MHWTLNDLVVEQRLNVEYKRVVESYDPQAIAFFVQRNPFHADALLQLVSRVLSISVMWIARRLLLACLDVRSRISTRRRANTQAR